MELQLDRRDGFTDVYLYRRTDFSASREMAWVYKEVEI